ncbi:zinc-binding dehydrogenase [Nocardia arthritidis]|uniref:Zinc-binding dehydrogenase n=2 Tax=Nocardia arthritidis TaxID=228602 RepID=A0A6G9YVS9_9NOCA|nr:zinc-binding dehydrogenase [Nocardia arthritidis]
MASPIPDGASAVDAVALVRSGLVARGALEAANPKDGESALITAAASGVGHLALQLARIRGAGRVVAAVSDPSKAEFVRGLGADEVVEYQQESWGTPSDYALDAVGGELLGPVLAALAPGGRLVAYSSGGGVIQAYDLLVGGKSAIGFQMARIATGQPALYEQWRQELWQFYAARQLKPAVHAEFALADAAKAHEVIESRGNLGKVVLIP